MTTVCFVLSARARRRSTWYAETAAGRTFAALFGERYASMAERKCFVVFGDPSDELRTLLDKYGATYHRPFGPFSYWG